MSQSKLFPVILFCRVRIFYNNHLNYLLAIFDGKLLLFRLGWNRYQEEGKENKFGEPRSKNQVRGVYWRGIE